MSTSLSLPEIHLKWAQTLDGQLCDDQGSSQWVSSEAERLFTHAQRPNYDAIGVGAATYLKDRAQLTVRHGLLPSGMPQPARLLFDPHGRIAEFLARRSTSERAAWVADLSSNLRPTYVFGQVRGLVPYEGEGLLLAEADLDFENPVFPAEWRRVLTSFRKVQIEGGPRLLTHLLRQGLFDEIHVSIAAQLTGGSRNRIDLGRLLSDSLRLELVETKALGSDAFVRYRKEKK